MQYELRGKGPNIYMKDVARTSELSPASHLYRISPWPMRRSAISEWGYYSTA
jgi:hypothetical protein